MQLISSILIYYNELFHCSVALPLICHVYFCYNTSYIK